MIKKETRILFGVVGLVLFAVVLGVLLNTNLAFVSALEPGMPDVLGISPENIDKLPQTPEELANVSSTYLKGQWQIILVNNSVIGPIHRWSMAHQGFYEVLFNEHYDLSLKFFLIFIFWWYVLIFVANVFELPQFLNMGAGTSIFPGFVAGFVTSLVLAHVNFFNMFVSWIITITNFAKGSWWKGLIVWSVGILLLTVLYTFGSMWKKSRRKAKEEAEKREVKTSIKESKAFLRGVEEGQAMTKDIRKLSEKYPGAEGWKAVGSSGIKFRKTYK
jgi:hypothetical protein